MLVHMMPDELAAELFRKYRLDDVGRISDSDRRLYQAFGLKRGTVGQVMGPRTWWRGFKAAIAGHRVGKPVGDIYQMSGAFLVADGTIVRRFESKHSGDLPDYVQLATVDD